MQRLIQNIRQIVSVRQVDEHAIVALEEAAREALPGLQQSLNCATPPKPGRYLCYSDADYGFVILILVWGPGDSTPIHDHGIWGVELVIKNELRVTNYDQSETDPQPLDTRVLGAGAIMHNLPPARDVHKVEYASGDYALSVHIYGAAMTQNRAFEPGVGFRRCQLDCRKWPTQEF